MAARMIVLTVIIMIFFNERFFRLHILEKQHFPVSERGKILSLLKVKDFEVHNYCQISCSINYVHVHVDVYKAIEVQIIR